MGVMPILSIQKNHFQIEYDSQLKYFKGMR
jgi:hypothetical protein